MPRADTRAFTLQPVRPGENQVVGYDLGGARWDVERKGVVAA